MLYEREMLNNFVGFAAFRRRCRAELLIMLVLDLYLAELIVLSPMKTFALYLTALAVWAVKLAIPFFMRGRLYCILGIGICAAELGILAFERTLDVYTAVLLIASALLGVLRFSRTLTIKDMSMLYGYPSFNGVICSTEAQRDPKTAELLDAQVIRVRSDDRLRAALRTVNESYAVKAARVAAVAVLLALMIFVQINMNKSRIEKGIAGAKTLTDVSETYDGEYVKCVTARIYAVQNEDADGGRRYWAEVGGRCVSLQVPNELNERFAVMESYYSKSNMLGVDVKVDSPGEDIHFVAIVHDKARNDEHFNVAALKRQSVDRNVSAYTEKWLETVSVE